MKRLLIFELSEIVGERLGIRRNIGESAWLRLIAISNRCGGIGFPRDAHRRIGCDEVRFVEQRLQWQPIGANWCARSKISLGE